MNSWYTLFLFVFVFSPVMIYGIGFEAVFAEVSLVKKLLLRIPLLLATVLLTVLVSKPLSFFLMSFEGFACLIPVFIFIVNMILSMLFVLFFPYPMSDGRPFSGVFSFGLSLLSVIQSYSLIDALLMALAGVVSFVVTAVIMSSVADRVRCSNVPLYFRGIPLMFISLGLLSLLFFAVGAFWWVVE